jgi:hypothetical protein
LLAFSAISSPNLSGKTPDHFDFLPYRDTKALLVTARDLERYSERKWLLPAFPWGKGQEPQAGLGLFWDLKAGCVCVEDIVPVSKRKKGEARLPHVLCPLGRRSLICDPWLPKRSVCRIQGMCEHRGAHIYSFIFQQKFHIHVNDCTHSRVISAGDCRQENVMFSYPYR